jgi:hypothetical protein
LRITLIIFILLTTSFLSISQEANSLVSLIGENEKEYEQLMAECSTPLLKVTNNSMDEAYDIWTFMLAKMTADANDSGLDIKGVKIWINLFWSSDGSIKKILYYPKPKSKNMDFDQLTSFFESFAKNYNLDIEYDSCFSHHGTAAFPVNHEFVDSPEGRSGN